MPFVSSKQTAIRCLLASVKQPLSYLGARFPLPTHGGNLAFNNILCISSVSESGESEGDQWKRTLAHYCVGRDKDCFL
jgi:hypothetical protein